MIDHIISFSLKDALSLIAVIFYFVVIVVLYYVPLWAVTKNDAVVKKVIIPIAISAQTIFGYLFYVFGITRFYPISYFAALLILNVVLIYKYRHSAKMLFRTKRHVSPLSCFLFFLIILLILYSRLYDSILFNAPGNPDALSHFLMLKEVAQHGQLSNSYYAPGFHLLLLPISILVSTWEVARFAGPAIGLLFLTNIYFLFKDQFKNKASIVAMLFLFCSPFFDRFGLQTIGFFPSALTFIFVPTLIYLASKPAQISTKHNLAFASIVSVALATTVPYLFVQIIPAFVLLLILAKLFHLNKDDLVKHLKRILLIFVVGLIVAFVHVYLLTKVIHHSGGFPVITTVDMTGDQPTISTNYDPGKTMTEITKRASSVAFLGPLMNTSFYNSMVKPMVSSGIEVFAIKNLITFNGILGVGAWLYLLVFIALILYSTKTKNKLLFILATAGFLFGVSALTGVLEMSYYRGRAGWYYNLLIIISAVYVLDYFIINKLKYWRYVALACLGLMTIYRPLKFPRLFYPEQYAFAGYLDQTARVKTLIITSESNVGLITGEEVATHNFEIAKIDQSEYKDIYIVLEKKPMDKQGVMSNIIFSLEKDLYLAQKDANNKAAQAATRLTQTIKESEFFKGYSLYTETENIQIYRKK